MVFCFRSRQIFVLIFHVNEKKKKENVCFAVTFISFLDISFSILIKFMLPIIAGDITREREEINRKWICEIIISLVISKVF